MQTCKTCGINKPLTSDYFYRDKGYTTGLRKECKECMKEYQRARQGDYDRENRDSIRERKKRYYKKNRDKILNYSSNYHKNNREQRRKYYEEYNVINQERIAEQSKRYKQENPEKVVRYSQVRRAREASLPYSLTEEEWENILNKFGNSCAYCGRKTSKKTPKLQQEHFIPLVSGGGYTAENIIPACSECNSSKHTKSFSDWYPTYKYYSATREVFIKKHIYGNK